MKAGESTSHLFIQSSSLVKRTSLTLLAIFLVGCSDSLPLSTPSGYLGTFPNHEDILPADYQGQTFQLRQDYPVTMPNTPKPWEAINFKTEPKHYLAFIKQTLYQGMAEADWRPGKNQEFAWYHMPWVTQGRRAREGLRGLNRNADVKPFELAPEQTEPQQKWELSFYNDYAAYQVGQVWRNPALKGAPDLTKTEFPEGSFIAKFVFITGSDSQLPFMQGAPSVIANIHQTIDRNSPKTIAPVRLVQMDFAIRDKRADDTTSWVMGAYVYDKNSPGQDWDKMVPIGLQWGNDPDITPSMVKQGIKLKETILMPTIPEYAAKRMGYGGRLNGPLDQLGSSCLGCHSMAQWPGPLNKTPLGNSEQEKMAYFRNLKPDEPFEKDKTSLDYQLHLENSFRTYYAVEFKKQNSKQSTGN